MRPAWSERNFTPTSTEFESPLAAFTGAEVAEKMEHGQAPGTGVFVAVGVLVAVGVAVGVLVGGPGVGVFVGVAVGPLTPSSTIRLSKLVSQPLVLPRVIVAHAADQLVTSVVR